MFYISSLVKELCINPEDIREDMKDTITSIIKKLEGTIIGNMGYIIRITEFNQISDCNIDNETGKLLIKVNYKAITFRLEKDEIVHAIIININEHGLFCKIGKCKIFVSRHFIDNYENDIKNKIEINKLIKLKITNVKIDYNEISAIGCLI